MNPLDPLVIIYGTNPISSSSLHSVARLLGDLSDHLATSYPDNRLFQVCPSTGQALQTRRAEIPVQLNRIESFLASHLSLLGIDPGKAWAIKAIHKIRNLNPKLVICCTPSIAQYSKQLLKVPVIYWIHSLPKVSTEKPFFRSFDKVDAVVVPTYSIYTALWNLYERNRLQAPFWIIPNWVNIDQFYWQTNEEKKRLRDKYNLHQDALIIIHVGGKAKHKGYQVLKSALMSMKSDTNVILLSVGNQQPVIEYEVSNNLAIRHMGMMNPTELNELYGLADIGCLPSVWFENAPLALLEMMTAGLCIIASNAGGIPELVQDGQEALLVSYPNDVEGWKQALYRVINDKQLRSYLGRNASITVKKHNDKEKSLAAWDEVIRMLLRLPA